MPLGSQPRRARGTVEHPYSALRLRLVLALFGIVVCVAGGIIVWGVVGAVPIAIAFFVLAAIAVVDAVVVAMRLRAGA
jgi:NhaP-type Na+/H+ or K+/H+ antiporter